MIELLPSRAIAAVIFGFPVHWYGVLYLLAFLNTAWMLPALARFRVLPLTRDEWTSVLSAGILGVIVGGRLGFVLFYEPQYFLQNPLKVFAVWEGGMASHGGFIGVIAAILFMARKYQISPLALSDVASTPIAIGLGLGRLGNFINQELFGVQTSLPWAITIPGLPGTYHPLQLYDMGLSFMIALACYLLLRLGKAVNGRVIALFLVLYAIMRFCLEFIRVQEYAVTTLGSLQLTRGQLLSIPILVLGIGVFVFTLTRKKQLQQGKLTIK